MQSDETLWLVVDTNDLDAVTDERGYYLRATIERSVEPPVSNDEGLMQIPIAELLNVARHSVFTNEYEGR